LGLSRKKLTTKPKKERGRFYKQEAELFKEIGLRRAKAQKVSGWWMRRFMRQLVKKAFPALFQPQIAPLLAPQPDREEGPIFGANWLYRFVRRFDLSWRKTKKLKNCTPQDRLPRIQRFHQGLQRLLQDPDGLRGQRPLDQQWGRFPPKSRFNWDEIPWAFIGGLSGTWTNKVECCEVVIACL
jgi:hypothetical protein